MIKNLNAQQKKALKSLLNSKANLFITGAAGTGKSHVIKMFREIKKLQGEQIPMVASTGVAAILVNGITFNSYFGLGIMAGGKDNTIQTALKSRTVVERIIYTDTVVIDEISMISGEVLNAANELCQKIRKNKKFFGGIRIICVGDFYQLGPFTEENKKVDWAFDSKAWKTSQIKTIELTTIMRTKDKVFLDILSKVRKGKVDVKVQNFLKKHTLTNSKNFVGARIFSRNHEVDSFNLTQLKNLEGHCFTFKTQFVGETFAVNKLKEQLCIDETILLKKGALVMMRVNNFQENYINGTLGIVTGVTPDVLTIKKLNGEVIHVKKHIFEFTDGNGEVIAKARNFPLTLAWAVTIQKSQGATLDKALISLDRLWLHGQAYTALSRLVSSQGLFISKWNKSSFIVDKKVLKKFKK